MSEGARPYFRRWNFIQNSTFLDSLVWPEPEERSMAAQIVMNHSGDTRYSFDAADAKSLQEAESRFKELTGSGFTAAIRTASGGPAVIHKFDPTADETLFFPRLVGG
jgi:hypothetical protein